MKVYFCALFSLFPLFLFAQSGLLLDDLEALYLDLHRNPELSFQEVKTAKRMADELRQSAYTVTEGVGGNGVVGVLKNGPGPTILVRADMDALPIVEETGLSYASVVRATDIDGKEVGVMHACGHDIHMTVWCGTARYMAEHRDEWSGTLVFIGQPAEERSGGAKAMLADGLYTTFPEPDYALGLHASASLPAGKVGVCPGYSMANVDMVDITVYGEGGHGAAPHTTKDPVILAARLVMAMQTIVSREINPLEPAVLTVGSIHGGSKGNVISNEVKLELTLRSYSDEVRNVLIEKIQRVANGIAMSAGLEESQYPTVFVRDEYTPSLYNDPAFANRIQQVFEQAIGTENVEQVKPQMVGEDFGRYGRTEEQVPILLYWLGSVDPVTYANALETGQQLPSLHSSKYQPLPRQTIETGVKTMTAALMDLCRK